MKVINEVHFNHFFSQPASCGVSCGCDITSLTCTDKLYASKLESTQSGW